MPDDDHDNSRRQVELRKLADSDQPGTIEFALMLDRAIEAFRNDPELLRSAVYELARTKLRDQLGDPSSGQARDVLASLETAISKVEAFSQSQPALLFRPADLSGKAPLLPASASVPASEQPFGPRRPRLRTLSGYIVALLVALVAVTAIAASRGLVDVSLLTAYKAKNEEIAAAPVMPPPPKRPMPPTYGAFAKIGDEFVELQPIGIRPPDIRIAVSSQIKLPDRAVLNTNSPSFVIYERFPPAVARAEARAMAKILRVFGGDESGNPQSTWVVRNISTTFRVLMDPDRPDLLLVSPSADVKLKPGRYALVVGNNAYDFTIAGTADSSIHCLEQVVGANGTFYSPCK